MASNPAGGFADVLKQQEVAAIQGTTLTAAEERRIGRQQRDAFLRMARTKGFTVREVAKDTDYLKALVAKFVPRMKNGARYPAIELTVIDAPIPDGQSFPGGFLVFTTALLNEPDLLILDEPTEGLDLFGRQLLRQVVREFKATGKTVLLVSHVLPEVEELCDTLAVLVEGRLVHTGKVSELTAGGSLEAALKTIYEKGVAA